MIIAHILSVAVYSITWMLVLSLNQSYEDCTTIAVAAANKNQCVAISVIHLLSQKQCDFADLFPSATVISTFIILAAHFLWNKCRYGSVMISRRKFEIIVIKSLTFAGR